MTPKLFKRCKHDWKLVDAIGGDTQAKASICGKCGKKKVKAAGVNWKSDFDYIIECRHKFR